MMNLNQQQKLSSELLECDLYLQKRISVYLIRSDQVHPQVSGNKWYKLKYSLLQAKKENVDRVISFGGAYSNHIHALAFAAQQLKIPAMAYIRGEWTDDNLTLRDAKSWGMTLQSLSREQYREKTTSSFLNIVSQQYPNSLIIPEGGSSATALEGVADLMAEIESSLPPLDCLIAACGTGGTLAGLICAAKKTSSILGIPVLKGASFLEGDIEQLMLESAQQAQCDWSLDLEGHYGGYGKVKIDHLLAMIELEKAHDIKLEPIYTTKMWRRFNELVSQNYFPAGSKIGLLHSGGLQGRRSFVDKYPDLFITPH